MDMYAVNYYTEWSDQYGCTAMVVIGPIDDLDEFIASALELGTTTDLEEPGEYDFVVGFRVKWKYGSDADERPVGPELYTEEALRSSLANIAGPLDD